MDGDPFTRQLERLAAKAEYVVRICWDPKLIAADVLERTPELQEMERQHKQALGEIELDRQMAKAVVDQDREVKRGQLDVSKQEELNRQRTEANDRGSRQKENSDG